MTTTEDLSTHEKRQLFGAYQTNKAVRLKIDALMHKCQIIECNLGIDSTDEEREIAKGQQLVYLSKIKELDPLKYDILKKVI
jgi:hypothetical protein|tara:strand:+ start:6477 stop:6722 length:246 start_codon:yes stop_codon:yes gene_type:complete